MRKTTKNRLLTGFIFLLVLLGINAVVSYRTTRRLIEHDRSVEDTYRSINELTALLAETSGFETSLNTAAASRSESDVERFQISSEHMEACTERLRTLIRFGSIQQQQADLLHRIVGNLLTNGKRLVTPRRGADSASERLRLNLILGRQIRTLRNEIVAVRLDTSVALDYLRSGSEIRKRAAEVTLVTGTVANMLLLLFVYCLLARAQVRKDELVRAYAGLKRSDSMRESLTAMLVHDLRTPLTTLLGSLETLKGDQEHRLDAETRDEMISMGTQSGYRLLGLINELLDISKMEAGEMSLRIEEAPVPGLVEEAIGQVARLDRGDSERILRSIPADLPAVPADKGLLVRVLINLMANALKFTPRTGTVEIGASCEQQAPAEARSRSGRGKTPRAATETPVLLFYVRDTGEGIPEEALDKIFEKFGQVETRKAGRRTATGLGLAFCRLAVEAHGGRIWVESRLGKGSTFYFTIPLVASAPSS